MPLTRKIRTAARLLADGDWRALGMRILGRPVETAGPPDPAPPPAPSPAPPPPDRTVRVKPRESLNLGPRMVAPGRPYRVLLRGLRPGRLSFEIRHADALILEQRKSLLVQVAAPPGAWTEAGKEADGATPAALAELLGINANARFAFAYMGGGREDSGKVRQVCTLEIPEGLKSLTLTLETAVDRWINIDAATLVDLSKVAGGADGVPLLAALPDPVEARLAEAGVRNLLLAEIDLNVIDGSSIWLSSMASILCHRGPTVLIARAPIRNRNVLDNIRGAENLILLTPTDFGLGESMFPDTETMAQAARQVDAHCATLDTVVSRGLALSAALLADHQFEARLDCYLTDFYVHEGSEIVIDPERSAMVRMVAHQARRILVQTEAIGDALARLSGVRFERLALPPPVPVMGPPPGPDPVPLSRPVRIGYAGKIAPAWGILELFDWVEALRAEGREVALTIIANKISAPGTPQERDDFRKLIRSRMAELEVEHFDGLPREETLAKMAGMDFAWCWRPPEFEMATLELSTKMVEGVANGQACIAYPSPINRKALGEDYPLFIETLSDLRALLDADTRPSVAEAAIALRETHDIATLSQTYLERTPLPAPRAEAARLCVSGHDMKFIDTYLSALRQDGQAVVRDQWDWGKPVDLARSERMTGAADVVLAEWGLANAVWLSQSLPEGKRLFVRIHLQEIQPRAARFGHAIHAERVERFIFVSARVRDEAVQMFGWPVEKTVVIPNFVDDAHFAMTSRPRGPRLRLGLVGIIPARKRLDRALDLMIELSRMGIEVELHVKGPRQNEHDGYRVGIRPDEAAYYETQYTRIASDPMLKSRVTFHPFGNDMALFYAGVDVILSPSDFESFHYALADGVLCGCFPVVWDWEEATELYDPSWVVDSISAAADRIQRFHKAPLPVRTAQLADNRRLVVERYGKARIFSELDTCLGLVQGQITAAEELT